jgi:hypothetical protein
MSYASTALTLPNLQAIQGGLGEGGWGGVGWGGISKLYARCETQPQYWGRKATAVPGVWALSTLVLLRFGTMLSTQNRRKALQ